MIWILIVLLLAVLIHHFLPELALSLALRAIALLYHIKLWFLHHERHRLQRLLSQIGHDQQALTVQEELQQALADLATDEAITHQRFSRYLNEDA